MTNDTAPGATVEDFTRQADESQERTDRMRDDASAIRELGEGWQEFCTRERYGWRHEELGSGIRERMGIVANWIEHVADQEQSAADDYRGAADLQRRIDRASQVTPLPTRCGCTRERVCDEHVRGGAA